MERDDDVAEALRARFGIDPRGSSALASRFALALQETPGDPRDPVWLASIAEKLRVGETRFYRDGAQLDALAQQVLGPALDRGACRVLSAGCSTGEEAYTLAAIITSLVADKPSRAGARWEVLGVDASGASVEVARRARYARSVTSTIPMQLRRAFVEGAGDVTIAPAVSARCRFVQGDLLDLDLPRKLGRFDAIVCRNVLIYFRDDHAQSVIARLGAMLNDGGALMVARAESAMARRSGLHPETMRGDVVLFRREQPKVEAREPEESAPPSRMRLSIGPRDRGVQVASHGSALLARGAGLLEIQIVGAVDDERAKELGPPLRRLSAAAHALGARVTAGDVESLKVLRALGVIT